MFRISAGFVARSGCSRSSCQSGRADTAAGAYAVLFAARKQAGTPTGTIDLMVAAIARSQGASVATRNRPDFAGCGLVVIDPWQAA
jgi:predicted nucleic acid-binding protein